MGNLEQWRLNHQNDLKHWRLNHQDGEKHEGYQKVNQGQDRQWNRRRVIFLKRKNFFFKDNMPTNHDIAILQIIETLSLILSWVTQ